jgi:hypothetical protein
VPGLLTGYLYAILSERQSDFKRVYIRDKVIDEPMHQQVSRRK